MSGFARSRQLRREETTSDERVPGTAVRRATLGVMVAPPGVENPDALAEGVAHGALTGLWWPDHWMGWAPNAAWRELGAIAESWVSPDLYADPFVEMVQLGASTGARLVGTAVTDVVRRHPVGLLQTVETVLRALPDTHIILGIGSGEGASLKPYGLARAPFAQVVEALHVLREARDSDVVTHRGRHWSLDRAPVPTLLARDRMRMWLGAHGPRMRNLAARQAEGWIPIGFSPETIRTMLQTMRPRASDAWTAAACIPLVVLGDGLSRSDVSSSLALRTLALSWSPAVFRKLGEEHPLGDDFDPLADLSPGHLSSRHALELVEAVPPSVVEEIVVCGDVDLIADHLRRFVTAGVEHLVGWELGYLVRPRRRGYGLRLLYEAWTRAGASSASHA